MKACVSSSCTTDADDNDYSLVPPDSPPLPDPPNNDSNTAEYSKLNLATGHDYEVVEETMKGKEN